MLRQARPFSSSTALRQAVVGVERVPAGTVGTIPVRRPVGGFRGGLLGFFLGFSIASAYTSYYLLQEYKFASSLLQSSVEELQESTAKMTNHLQRIQAVEKEVVRLNGATAVKEEVTKLRSEMKKLYDGVHVENLDLRAHVWGIEQDLQRSAKNDVLKI